MAELDWKTLEMACTELSPKLGDGQGQAAAG
jgi:hypothetical protein